MNSYVITTDSASDLPEGYVKKHNLYVQPLFYNIDDQIYGGNHNLDNHTFYQMMRDGKMPITNAIIPAQMVEDLRPLLEKGQDILHISFSSGLSSSYQNAVIAANELEEEFPERKIIVIDSKAASLGQGLLVHKALKLKETGKSLEEVADWVEETKNHICHQFTVNDLFHLHRGGRVSKATAILGTIASIKPVLHVDNEGKLIPLSNVRGRKKSLITLVDNMQKALEGFEGENDEVFISHGDCLDDAEFVAKLVKERLGIENIMIDYVSPTIGAHSGPGTVALFFLGKSK